MSAEHLDLLIIVYGSSATDPNDDSRFCGEGQRRAEIKLNPRIPSSMTQSIRSKTNWSRDFMLKLGDDMKHTQKWYCEFCDKPATETQYIVASWIHLTPPRLIAYVHHLCSANRGPCLDQFRMIKRQSNLMGTVPMLDEEFPDIIADFPLAASCATCKDPETAKQELNRCSSCKLIRYCGVKCQREDWKRHKEICKAVKEVSWVWPQGPSLKDLD